MKRYASLLYGYAHDARLPLFEDAAEAEANMDDKRRKNDDRPHDHRTFEHYGRTLSDLSASYATLYQRG